MSLPRAGNRAILDDLIAIIAVDEWRCGRVVGRVKGLHILDLGLVSKG